MFVYMIRLKVWCAVHIHVDWLVIEKCFIQGQSRSDRWSHYPNPNRKINSCTHPFKHSDFSLSFICLCDWTLFSLSLALQLSFSLHKLLFDLCRFPFYFDISLLLFGIYCKCLRVNCKWFCGFLVFADRLSHSIRWKKKKHSHLISVYQFRFGFRFHVWFACEPNVGKTKQKPKNITIPCLDSSVEPHVCMLYEDSNTLTLEHLLRWRARFYFEMRRNVMVFTVFFYCCGGVGCFALVTTIVCCASLTS